MSGREAKMVMQIAGVLKEQCGEEIAARVMQGKEDLKRSSGRDTAIWVKGAMNRMDELVDADRRMSVMSQCGRNCCSINKGAVKRFKKRRAEFQTQDDFFQAMMEKPMRGIKLSREGNVLRFYYTPRAFGKGRRCFCRLVSALPKEETMSMTYCQCSAGFVGSLWEQILEKPVEVKLIRSALSGSDECEFRIVF